ncbi:hypothetical protein M3215_07005 [Bacillus cytotoxicus]|uniref:Uncharacterized protein n=1 Tax=Bacillus cytotoxicus TaxID=580165 RepID=A0ACC6A6R2_9BACI|nr:hypothetical protein [Bacillus cytotoxicus]
MSGWIKIHRKITESAIWSDPRKLKLWMLCLLKASHKDREVLVGNKLVKLEPGQFVTGRDSLAEEFNKGMKKDDRITPRGLWKWIKLFETANFCSIKSTTKYSVITVIKWSEFQQSSTTVPTEFQQSSTNKNVKNNVVVEEEQNESNENQINLIADRYMQLKGRGFPSPEDYQTITELLQYNVPVKDILFYLEECFRNYRPKHTMDRINSFKYCARYIYERWNAQQVSNKPLTVIQGQQRKPSKRQSRNDELLAKYE